MREYPPLRIALTATMITITATCSKCGARLTNAGTVQVVLWTVRHQESCLGAKLKSIEVG